MVNERKSHWDPAHTAQWLGFNIDLSKGLLAIPESKMCRLKEMLAVAQEQDTIMHKTVASIVGRVISMGLGIGPVARLRTRSLYALLDRRTSWYDRLIVSEEARGELQFWSNSLDYYNGQNIWRSAAAVRVVYSDASGTGYGGYVVEHGQHIAHGQWEVTEVSKSSTWRELAAVARVIKAVAPKLANHRVKWFTDNQNVVRIIAVGSRVVELQALAVEIFRSTLCHHISIEPEWIPCEENELADYVSRLVDHDDRMLNPTVFSALDAW